MKLRLFWSNIYIFPTREKGENQVQPGLASLSPSCFRGAQALGPDPLPQLSHLFFIPFRPNLKLIHQRAQSKRRNATTNYIAWDAILHQAIGFCWTKELNSPQTIDTCCSSITFVFLSANVQFLFSKKIGAFCLICMAWRLILLERHSIHSVTTGIIMIEITFTS